MKLFFVLFCVCLLWLFSVCVEFFWSGLVVLFVFGVGIGLCDLWFLDELCFVLVVCWMVEYG